MELEVIKSNKGGVKLCYQGHMYTKQVTRRSTIRWRCVRRTTWCKGTMTTDLEMGDPKTANPHNHSPDDASISATKVVNAMKRKAADTQDKPSAIYAELVQTIDDSTKAQLRDQDSIKRTLRNQRANLLPPKPASLRELHVEGEWKQTSGGDPFLFYDNGPETNARLIIFGTNTALEYLAAADTWMMDGNFAMAPPGFLQLYVIRVPLAETAVSTIYALLQNKTQDIYEELLQAVMARCHELDLTPDPATVIVDFEQAVIQAIRSSLGPEVQTQGCFYHLTQSTWRKIQDLGLTNTYKDNEGFRQFCGEMDSLALLPVDDVGDGMAFLRDRCPPDALPLLLYFDATYVSGTYRPARRRRDPDDARVNLRRVPPRYPPEVWNVHQATVNDCPRTNNQCEGWNCRFFHLVGHHHPSIWKCIQALKQEEATVSTILAQDAVGQPPKKKRKRVYVEQQQRLKNLCEDYLAGHKTMAQFLSGAGHSIRFGDA